MTSFLFIPTTFDARQGRRVDFAGMACLFAVSDETLVAPRSPSPKGRLIASLLILLCALGDTVLIARPDPLMSCLSGSHIFGGSRDPARS